MTQDWDLEAAGRTIALPVALVVEVGPSRPRAGDPVDRPIDAAARARIGRELRLHYAATLALPIPDRLLALVDRLAGADAPDRRPAAGTTDDTADEGGEG